jgi:hypothetical protein
MSPKEAARTRPKYKRREVGDLPRYPSRPIPKPGESANGYLVRFAQEYDRLPNQIAYAIGAAPFGKGLHSPGDIERYSIVAGLSVEEARLLFTRNTDYEYGYRTRSILGHQFFETAIAVHRRRICPMCLWDDPYHRAVWALTFVNVCRKHRIDLVSHCPSCKEELSWNVSDISICQCGYDLRLASDYLAPRLKPTNEELAGRLIEGLLVGDVSELPPGLSDIPPMLFCILMRKVRERFVRRHFAFDPLRSWEGYRDIVERRPELVSEWSEFAKRPRRHRRDGSKVDLVHMGRIRFELRRDSIGADLQSVLTDVIESFRAQGAYDRFFISMGFKQAEPVE